MFRGARRTPSPARPTSSRPNLLNEFRLGFNRVSVGSFQENLGRNLNAEVGLPQVSGNPRDPGLSLVSITGYSAIGDESHNPQHSARTSYQIIDTVTNVRGRHLLKAGVDLRWLQQNAYRDEMARGFLSFLGMTGNALAEMLQGLPSLTGVARLDNHQHLRTHSAYFFVQDTWRFRPDLTLSAGLRYEYNAPPVDAGDRANVYDPATESLVRVGTNGIPRGGYEPDRNNWAPRIGLAWRPGQGGTVLRAGYGLYYDQAALATGEGLYFNAPYFDFKLYFPLEQHSAHSVRPVPPELPRGAALIRPGLPEGPAHGLRAALELRPPAGDRLQPGRGTGVLPARRAPSCSGGRDLNQPLPSAQQPNPRPVPQFDDITVLESRGNSNYHSSSGPFPAEPPARADGPGLLHLVEVD